MVTEPDPNVLRLIRERDDARREQLRLARVAAALKLHNDRLRHQVRHLTADSAARTTAPARKSAL
jgi:hypothetical protein